MSFSMDRHSIHRNGIKLVSFLIHREQKMSDNGNFGNRNKSSRPLSEHPEDYGASVDISESKEGVSTGELTTAEDQVLDLAGNFVQVNVIVMLSTLITVRDCDKNLLCTIILKSSLHHVTSFLRESPNALSIQLKAIFDSSQWVEPNLPFSLIPVLIPPYSSMHQMLLKQVKMANGY